MQARTAKHGSGRPYARARRLALLLLLTGAATWLWAHEGHAPLPSTGSELIKDEHGRVVGVTLTRRAREALDVRTAAVEQRPVEERLLAPAVLVSPLNRHAYATARLPGRIVQLHVRPGQHTDAGQPLAEVQSLELEDLQLQLLNARSDAELSAKLVERLTPLAASGAAADQELLEARTRHQQDANALEVARARWLSLGLTAGDLEALFRGGRPAVIRTLPVRSPIAGTVTHADLAVGKVVEPAEHLFEVVDSSSVWARVGVLEKDLHRVAVSQLVEVSLAAYPGEVFRSTVRVKGLSLDPQTHLGAAWAELPNPAGGEPRLLPGMYGQARLPIPGKPAAVTVPAEALLRDGAERYLLVEKSSAADSSQYLKVNVVAGRRTPDRVEVLSGSLYPGDLVVTRGGHELREFFAQGVLRVSPEAARTIGLQVEPARPRVVEEVAEVEGAVDVPPDRRATVSSQLAGTVQKIHVERGQAVRAGEVVVEVASLELQALQLELLKSSLEGKLLEESLQRLRRGGAGVSPRQVLELESRVNAGRNQRDSLTRKLEAAGLSTSQLEALVNEKKLAETVPLRAPFGGALVSFEKVLGQAVKAGEPLFEVHDLTRPWVQAHVSPGDLARVSVGQKARVRLVSDPGLVLEGTVVRSGRAFGGESRTLSAWVELDRPPDAPLLHGQLAHVALTLGRPAPALAVPLAAVVREGTQAYVFIRNADGTFDRRAVETGRADDRYVEVVRHLEAGEAVAVAGTAELQTAFASLR
jgi:RND family efflux transporter MFP subunit